MAVTLLRDPSRSWIIHSYKALPSLRYNTMAREIPEHCQNNALHKIYKICTKWGWLMCWHNTVPLTQSTRKDSDNHTACLADVFPNVVVTSVWRHCRCTKRHSIPLNKSHFYTQDFARNTAPYVKTATEVFFRNYEVWQIVARPEISCRL